MVRKPWPGTMIVSAVLSWLVAGGLAAVAIVAFYGFLQESSHANASSDWLVSSVHGFFGTIALFIAAVSGIPGAILCVVSGLVMGRWPWSRIVYSVAIGAFLLAAISCSAWNLNPAPIIILLIPLVIAAVLMWLPPSAPFFVRSPRYVALPPVPLEYLSQQPLSSMCVPPPISV